MNKRHLNPGMVIHVCNKCKEGCYVIDTKYTDPDYVCEEAEWVTEVDPEVKDAMNKAIEKVLNDYGVGE